eukprot:TRINITY_DN18638_c0_g1_i1.p1 TRINITY_DN18638_c0_g1~~TRINITY_DN18638_c0_g1_i1.p1  ORF type:complete len:524 (-),score=73.93 TRINITY_DN18638_c0_g1_i1:235-1806(-)
MSTFEGGNVPDQVQKFVAYLYRHVREGNVQDVSKMVNHSFHVISQTLFNGRPWPSADAVADLVDRDHVFLLLYQELTNRHLYARATKDLTLQQRADSWENYCQLFGIMLDRKVRIQLPTGWLWDMIDEFVYQFQNYQHFRGRSVGSGGKTEIDHMRLKECDAAGVWNAIEVLNQLQALVDKSDIASELQNPETLDAIYQTDGVLEGGSNVLRMLGYFALIGLLRVHTLLGDFESALKAVSPINFHVRHNLYVTKIAHCNIALHYYAGYCYFSMRAHIEAARAFNTILQFISRVKQQHKNSAVYEQILQKNEQMYHLLAITVAVCPAAQRVLDDNVYTTLREKHGQDISKMSRADMEIFEQLFNKGCPKFVTPYPPEYDNPHVNFNIKAFETQLHLFLQEIQQQARLPDLKQYLKLYSSIPLPKLANIMEIEVEELRTLLLCLKMKSFDVQWEEGKGNYSDLSAAVMNSTSDVDFHISRDGDVEMVEVKEKQVPRRNIDFLVRNIQRFEDIVTDLETPAPPTRA